jgi:hypothetical protein
MAFKLKGPTLYKNKYGDDGLVKREHKEFNPEDTGWVDPYVESRLEAQEKVNSLKMKKKKKKK